jgi:aminopeptidase N
MEYPMICFNGGRPEKDGTYSERTKYGMIGVIIHEVGHNFFPMIINSDERQWTWMDEGLNTFVQYLTEQEWDRDYPSWRGKPRNIVDYMKGDPEGRVHLRRVKARIEPIMTNSESITQFGNNAYGKPCTALNILRETVMGRELFDHAFKTYAERWKFKHPTPADFFRTMEDASGVDLDWFWRGWFYTTDHVDLALSDLKYKRMDPRDPGLTEQLKRQDKDHQVADLSRERNIENKVAFVVDRDPAAPGFLQQL